MSIVNTIERILEKSNNGGMLTETDRSLVFSEFFNETAEIALHSILSALEAGTYADDRWFCRIENLTRDAEGYVYWKGIHVEHYSFDNPVKEKAAAQTLADNCKLLEAKGIEVDSRTAISRICVHAPADSAWKLAMRMFYAFFEKDGVVHGIFFKSPKDRTADVCPVVSLVVVDGELVETPEEGAYEAYHRLRAQGMQSLGTISTYDQLMGVFSRMNLVPNKINLAIQGQ